MRKIIGVFLAVWAVLALPLSAAAFTVPEGYSNNRLIIAAEPDITDDEHVGYYENDKSADLADITWVEGRPDHGKAVTLGGDGDYLSIGYYQLRLTNFSVSMWVNWQGGEAGQNLLTIWQDEDNYIALSPYATDPDHPDPEGKILNGLELTVVIEGEKQTAYRASLPSVQTSLPTNEWHQITIVGVQPQLSLYVDGVLWTETTWAIGLRELNPDFMHIGDNIGDGPFLNAVVDDVEIYATDLSYQQIKLLAAGLDPLDPEAVLPPSATRAPITTTTTAAAIDAPGQPTSQDPSLDLALTVAGVGLGLFVLLTAGSLLFGKKPTSSDEKGGDDR